MTHSPQTKFSNVTPIKLINIQERDTTTPGNVGSLPLHYFIYILIGVLVLLCCSFWIWEIFRIIISPREYLERMRKEAIADVPFPYREIRPHVPGRVNNMTRGEVEKYRTQERYQADGFLERLLVTNLNLPLPIGGDIQVAAAQRARVGINIHQIETWGNLVKEKKEVNIMIANLERLTQVRMQEGRLGPIDPKLRTALQRRAEIEIAINASYAGFAQRRGEWSMEEWQAIELIMQYSPR